MQNILIINSIKYVEQIIKFAWKINAIMELRRSIISHPNVKIAIIISINERKDANVILEKFDKIPQ